MDIVRTFAAEDRRKEEEPYIIKVKQEAVIMESAGKWKQWKNQLKTNMEKNARVLDSRIRVAGPST